MMDKNRKILLMDILQGAVVIFLVGWLCYKNLIASLAGMVVLPIFIRFKAKKRVNQRQTRLWKEFKDVTAMMYKQHGGRRNTGKSTPGRAKGYACICRSLSGSAAGI